MENSLDKINNSIIISDNSTDNSSINSIDIPIIKKKGRPKKYLNDEDKQNADRENFYKYRNKKRDEINIQRRLNYHKRKLLDFK